MTIRLLSVSLCLLALLWLSLVPVSAYSAQALQPCSAWYDDLCHSGAVPLEPLHPTTEDCVAAHVSGWWGSSCPVVTSEHEVLGSHITLSLTVADLSDSEPVGCLDVVTPWAITHTLGQLPAGSYTLWVDVAAGSCWSFHEKAAFAVAPGGPAPAFRQYWPYVARLR